MKKYYFITYQGENKDGSFQVWNLAIDISPMAFIKMNQESEKKAEHSYYRDFVVLNTCEITAEEFAEFDGHF